MELMLLDAHFSDQLPAEVLDIVKCDIGETSGDKSARLFLFAKDHKGISYCVTVNGYKPWIRLMSRGITSKESLQALIAEAVCIDVASINIVEEKRPRFYGFCCGNGLSPRLWTTYKIYFLTFQHASKAEQIFKFSSGYGSAACINAKKKLVSEYEITDELFPITKAFNELDLTPCEWFYISDFIGSAYDFSTCNQHIDAKASNIKPRPKITLVAPIKVFSFDAEMYSQDNSFPEVIHGDIIMAICVSIFVYGSNDFTRHAFVLDYGQAVELDGISVHICSDSLDLMDQFRDLVAIEDPDILTGWNIYGFDMPYMWDSYQDSFKARFMRGSENMHLECLIALGRQNGFLTTKDLLKMNKKGPKTKAFIDKMEMRQKLNLQDPDKLPEYIACELRTIMRAELGLKSEQSQNNFFGGQADFLLLKQKGIYRFAEVFEPARVESFKRFEHLGRICSEKSSLKEKRMVSGAKGDNTYYFWSGRTTVDLMHIIKDDKKLESNTLKFIAQSFLDPEYGKIDMGPHEIFAAWREKNPEKIKDMLLYCMRDADIPNLLIKKMSYIPIWVEKSRVTCTTIQQLMNGGQQRSIHNLLSRFIRDTHIFNKGQSGWPVTDYEFSEDDNKKSRPDYQGATVIEPTPGYYISPEHPCISTLDFESLYPSIMVHFNLCPSVFLGCNIDTSIVSKELVVESHKIKHSILVDLKNDSYSNFENTYSFVKNVQGVIPRLLQHLLAARKIAKRAMNSAPDEFERSVQNSRQLALKTSCNSVYGFFGVRQDKGLCSFKPASAVTTLWGRNFLEHAKTYVESHYEGSKVLYGDTDSIMISWGPKVTSVYIAYNLAEEASASITQLLRNGSIGQKPVLDSASCAVTLANEKVYTSFLLIQKKMYAAMKFTLKNGHKCQSDLDFENCLDMKGIDAVRRDRTKMVKMLSEKILDSLLVKQDLGMAMNLLKETLDTVSNQKAPLDWLVLSKSLKSSYVSQNQPHLQARLRMISRGSQIVPEIGDRMPYIITAGRNGPLYERTEHPEFVESLKLKYCAKYYIENARDVIERLLGPTGKLKEVSHLFVEALNVAELKASGQMSLKSFFKKQKL